MSDNINKEMKQSTEKTGEVLKEEVVEMVENQTKSTTSSASNISPVLTQTDLAALDYSSFETPARMLALGAVLCKSQLVPLKKPEDVVVALMTGKELGLPFIASVSHIYPINGRPTLGVHIQRALCLKNSIIIEKLEDGIDIFEFAKADETGKPILVDKIINNQPVKVPVIIGTGIAQEQPKDTVKRAIDKRTTYKLTRELKMPSGKYKEVSAVGSFTLSEAKEAELIDKDVWKKYWRRMLDARAFTNAVKEIADDITLGLPAPNELSNSFYINEKGEEVYDPSIQD